MAHRGDHRRFTENSQAAMQAAVDLGYAYVESDVHLSSDGVAVLSHDPDLKRVADLNVTIAEKTWSQLSTIQLPCGSQLARLDETLASFPDVRFNLDAKVPMVVEPLAAVILDLEAQERTCVGSFDHESVARLRALLPDAGHSASPREVAALRFLPTPELAQHRFRADAAMIPTHAGRIPLASRRVIQKAHALKRSIHIWTVDSRDQMAMLLDRGVDGLMTDQPEILRDLLIDRGQW